MSPLKTGLLIALESAVNTSLQHDPATRHALSTVDGNVLQLACTAPAQSVYVMFVGEHVELWSHFDGKADTTLSGTASAFLQLWRHRESPTALHDSSVALTGDTALLQQLQSISHRLNIDWEALLATHTGDLVAHQVGQAVRGARYWLRSARQEAERLMGEFLQYEQRSTPSRHDVQRFCHEVDELSLRMDRLQARLAARRERTSP